VDEQEIAAIIAKHEAQKAQAEAHYQAIGEKILWRWFGQFSIIAGIVFLAVVGCEGHQTCVKRCDTLTGKISSWLGNEETKREEAEKKQKCENDCSWIPWAN
jgi:hypothetical protein